ncbi:arabinogalactan oligomer/maltooligosaccharide transport system permease protein [Barrientosiimonas humi]|uniref:Arabinogalactan oligomer/maltooligosaccharide transport system permease protein n=2 Tax=Barrientosiimonas TaxID=1535207 RepID=A0A542XEZ8_9MICO|nr:MULTISPECIES: sugar ABC transporter permease [Barrientosiimonas]TQL34395.1 arabinogalactan oligomer/maltooligosaccharide transport system permease protein [Barrientosiimonas humi]BDZ59456.1 sugar ABC transporter permease [Barrientosiimonas endolithica]CAG7574385.1 Maltose transport system permease protein MalG [Barrientosiimonas humi]
MSAVAQPNPITPAVGDELDESVAVADRQPPRGHGSTWWRHALGILALVWALFPIVFLLSAALNRTGSLSTSSLLPQSFSLNNFSQLFNDPARPYTSWYRNSLIISLVGSLATVFIGACAAYAFSRLRFQGRRPGLMALLLLQLFPGLLAVVALYLTFNAIGDVLPGVGLNTTWGLILAYLGGAMGANIWLLKGYFDTVPRELDEAARVDGASHARIFFTMTLRLVMPILVTVFMVSFVSLFGEFMLASIFLLDADKQTLAVGLWSMSKGNEANRLFGQFAAGSLLGSLPTVLLYLAFQKQLIGGATAGSVK